MGTSESKQIKCPYCAALISPVIHKDEHNDDDSDSNNHNNKPCKGTKQCSIASELPDFLLLCPRCHGTIKNIFQKQKTKNASNKNKKMLKMKNEKNESISPPLKQPKLEKRCIEHLYVAPFGETLLDIKEEKECKEMNEHILSENYLKPFFKKHENQAIRRGNRLIIDGIEFKVFACYPPKGFVVENTQIHLSDHHNYNESQSSTINSEFLKLTMNSLESIHLLPSKVSLLTYYKKHGIPDPNDKNAKKNGNKKRSIFAALNNSDNRNNNDRNNSDHESDSNDESKTQIDNDSNNNAPSSSTNIMDENVRESIMKHLKLYLRSNDRSFYVKIEKKTKKCKENGENNKTEEKDDFTKKKPLSRHLMTGETFIAADGIEWTVMKCVNANDKSKNNGIIDNATTMIYYDQMISYLDDCRVLTIRPIHESLPRMHQNCTPKQIYKLYLDPFFFGGIYRNITPRREVQINGVSFAVRNVTPNHGGIVSCNTKLDYFAAPVKHRDLMQLIHDEDLEMAQRMETEQNERLYAERMTAERRRRHAQMDQNDIEAMIDRYRMQPDPFLSLMAMIAGPNPNDAQQNKKRKGISKKLIRLLPTYKFSTPTSSMSDMKADCGDDCDGGEDGEDGDGNTGMNVNFSCRICLEYYENEEELRILPCFHKYHKDCVDKWMGISSKCPICKTSIVKQLTR